MSQNVTIRTELICVKRRENAHRTLDRLIDEAEAELAYGRVGVSVSLEAGKITVVHKTLEGTEK